MIFKQVHSLPTSPSLVKIALYTLGAVAIIYCINKITEPEVTFTKREKDRK